MFEQGDIIMIPVPFSDLSSEKHRPVLVLSTSAYNSGSGDFLAAAITSNLRERAYAIPLEQAHMASGNLPRPSCIRADKLYTLAQSIALKKLGSIMPERLSLVKKQVMRLMG